MFDYKMCLQELKPISEKDLVLFEVSSEEKTHLVKQYNRALLNAKSEGTDVAQIFLKPLIATYPKWGDAALIFGLCLAREYQFKRAAQSIEYAINNVLSTEDNLLIAQKALKAIKEDIKNPIPKYKNPNENQEKGSMVSEMGARNDRRGMQAPILMRASRGNSKAQMATDRERREILMRAASSNGELPDDDIMVDIPSTPSDRMKITLRIVGVLVLVAALFCLVYFVIVPMFVKLNVSRDNERRLEYVLEKLADNKNDPTINSILNDYIDEFDVSSDSKTDKEDSDIVDVMQSAVNDAKSSPESVTESSIESSLPAVAEPSIGEQTMAEPSIAETSSETT